MIDFKKISSGFVPYCTDCGKHFGVAITDEERFLFTKTCPNCFPKIIKKEDHKINKRQKAIEVILMSNGLSLEDFYKVRKRILNGGFKQIGKIRDVENKVTTLTFWDGKETYVVELNGVSEREGRPKTLKEFDIEKFLIVYAEKGKEAAFKFANCSTYKAYQYLHSQGWTCKKGCQTSYWIKGDKTYKIWDARKKSKV